MFFEKNADCLKQLPFKFANVPVRNFITSKSSDVPLGCVLNSNHTMLCD